MQCGGTAILPKVSRSASVTVWLCKASHGYRRGRSFASVKNLSSPCLALSLPPSLMLTSTQGLSPAPLPPLPSARCLLMFLGNLVDDVSSMFPLLRPLRCQDSWRKAPGAAVGHHGCSNPSFCWAPALPSCPVCPHLAPRPPPSPPRSTLLFCFLSPCSSDVSRPVIRFVRHKSLRLLTPATSGCRWICSHLLIHPLL